MITPATLTADSFSRYPPQARAFATTHLAVLQKIPLSLLTIMLAQIIEYDTRFPAEQRSLTRQFQKLGAMDAGEWNKLMSPFSDLQLDFKNSSVDWVNQPKHFNEVLSASLWSSHQMDAYREAAHQYEEHLADAINGAAPDAPRLAIVLIGSGVARAERPLFRNLRPHGVLFNSVEVNGAQESIRDLLASRAATHSEPYASWYIDGGTPHHDYVADGKMTSMSYEELVPAAMKEMKLMDQFAQTSRGKSAVTAEQVQSFMGRLGPVELGLSNQSGDATLHQFQAAVFTGGAGTQIFSTTFVQWTAREVLRRAQPMTLLARYAPRQKAAPMNVMLHRDPIAQEKDAEGSLVDADMGAYYTWLNLTRLPGADQSRFLMWFEGHGQALAISPSLARGSVSSSAVTMAQILKWME